MKYLILLVVLGFYPINTWADEWDNFKPEDVGISNSEFDEVKAKGMSKKKLLDLVEHGIMPSEYFSEPWKKLGVSETEWLDEKKKGMENADIDRTLHRGSLFNYDPVVSFFLPGYYQWKTKRPIIAGSMTGLAIGSLGLLFLHQKEVTEENTTGDDPKTQKTFRSIYFVTLLSSMLWSTADAFYHTRYTNNPEAQRFSLGYSENGLQAILRMNF